MDRAPAFAGWVVALACTTGIASQDPTPASRSGTGLAQPAIANAGQEGGEGHTRSRSTVQGNALTATNGALADALVRLRDARSGRVVDTQITDKTGVFVFRPVDPGIYVVELAGGDQNILAASPLITVNAGDVASTFVKLPWRAAPAGGLSGRTAASAVIVLSAAAASGLLVTAATAPPVSGER